ncbi:unnamed protein product [Onchocerca flexuosa]|uniref:DNA-directed RNA polymerase n=1 Tax=Onchocerca flexuosa TaxID=387005 RepID=A0A183HT21_9BILA|nr:unnamed protein product [Onchocerca flexuosa]
MEGRIVEGEYGTDFANSEGKVMLCCCYRLRRAKKWVILGSYNEDKYVAQRDMSKTLGLDRAGAKEFNAYLNSIIVGQTVVNQSYTNIWYSKRKKFTTKNASFVFATSKRI